jgi:ceramide glucosyltransferase
LIESLFINTDFAALVMLARKVERASYAFGATIAMRREVLDEIGGFLPIANHLADDYQLGYRVVQRGYESALCNEIIETHIAVRNWRRLIDHQLRWARTYRIERPGGYFGTIVTHGTFWAVMNVLYHQFSPLSCLASLAVLGVRYISAANFAWRWLRTDISGPQLLLVAPKDLFVSFIWFLAFAGNTVIWSGRRFRVLRSGEMRVLTSPQPTSTRDTPLPVLSEESSRRAAGGTKR